MPRIVESLSAVNSLLRTGLAIVVVALVTAAAWFGYQVYTAGDRALREKDQELASIRHELTAKEEQLVQQEERLREKDQQITTLQVDLQAKEEKIQKLDTALRLLKVNRRIGWLTVLEQDIDPATNELFTVGQFVEVNEQGERLGEPKQFRIVGDVVYIDNWVVKFDDQFVERAEIDRSTSLVLFRRIFGEHQAPQDGYLLDTVGTRPQAYGAGTEMSDFERQIWDEFWTIANDEARARELGIRAAHGEAPSMKVRKGKSYKILLRASDGLSIVPDDTPPQGIAPPA